MRPYCRGGKLKVGSATIKSHHDATTPHTPRRDYARSPASADVGLKLEVASGAANEEQIGTVTAQDSHLREWARSTLGLCEHRSAHSLDDIDTYHASTSLQGSRGPNIIVRAPLTQAGAGPSLDAHTKTLLLNELGLATRTHFKLQVDIENLKEKQTRIQGSLDVWERDRDCMVSTFFQKYGIRATIRYCARRPTLLARLLSGSSQFLLDEFGQKAVRSYEERLQANLPPARDADAVLQGHTAIFYRMCKSDLARRRSSCR